MSCSSLFSYYQGETIIVDITSTEVDLNEVNFDLLLYKYTNAPYRISKSDMTAQEEGRYRAVVPSDQTALWPTGEYTAEIVVERNGGHVSIAKEICFEINTSASKGEI